MKKMYFILSSLSLLLYQNCSLDNFQVRSSNISAIESERLNSELNLPISEVDREESNNISDIIATPASDLTKVAVSTGKSYYISPSGNDSNPGSLSKPWKTLDRLQKAQSVLMPGDTVYFRGGSYMVTPVNRYYYSWSAKGSSTSPITYKNYNGETPVLTWDWRVLPPSKTYFIFLSGSYLIVDGLQFKQTEQSRLLGMNGNLQVSGGQSKSAIYVSGTNVKIRNSVIDNFSGVGVQTGSSTGLIVERSIVRNVGSHCFYIAGKNGILRNNILDGGRGYGNSYPLQFQYETSIGNKAYSNLVLNAQAAGVVFSGPVSNNEVFNNVFINAGASKTTSGGAVLSFWCETSKPPGIGNKFYNNTAIGKTNSILVNTVVGTSGGTYCRTSNGGKPLAELVTITSNIFYPSNSPSGKMLSLPKMTNNIFYNISGVLPLGNTLKNPLLVNPLGLTAASAMLKSGSPAINSGKSAIFPKTDYNGRSRPQGSSYDIGAFEY